MFGSPGRIGRNGRGGPKLRGFAQIRLNLVSGVGPAPSLLGQKSPDFVSRLPSLLFCYLTQLPRPFAYADAPGRHSSDPKRTAAMDTNQPEPARQTWLGGATFT